MKYGIILTIVFSLFFVDVFSEESAIEKQLAFYVFPEIDGESEIITKVKAIFVNTGETSLWLLSNDIKGTLISTLTIMEDGSRLGGGLSRIVSSHKLPPPLPDEYVEIKPNAIYGKTLTLNRMDKVKVTDYQANKVSFRIAMKIKMKEDDEKFEKISFYSSRLAPDKFRCSTFKQPRDQVKENVEEKE